MNNVYKQSTNVWHKQKQLQILVIDLEFPTSCDLCIPNMDLCPEIPRTIESPIDMSRVGNRVVSAWDLLKAFTCSFSDYVTHHAMPFHLLADNGLIARNVKQYRETLKCTDCSSHINHSCSQHV